MDSKSVVQVVKKKPQNKILSSIQELPTDWKLLTNATDEKDKFFIRDELKKNLAILEVTYVEQEVAITYVQFIGVKDTLVSAEITALRNSLYDYVARNRYKWYGKKETCIMPTNALKLKFL